MATLAATIAAMPPAPMPLWDVHLNRINKRVNGYDSVKDSSDYKVVVAFFPTSPLIQGPNPYNADVEGKRTWEKRMQLWRRQLAVQAATVSDTARSALLEDVQ